MQVYDFCTHSGQLADNRQPPDHYQIVANALSRIHHLLRPSTTLQTGGLLGKTSLATDQKRYFSISYLAL